MTSSEPKDSNCARVGKGWPLHPRAGNPRSLLHLPRQPAQLRIHKPRNLRRPVEVPQCLERVHHAAERAAFDCAPAVVDVYPAEEVVGQVDLAAVDRFSYPFLNTLSGILNCPPVAVSLSAKICRTLGSSSG